MSDPRSYILSQVVGDALVPVTGVPGAFIRQLTMGQDDGLNTPQDEPIGPWLIRHTVCDEKGALLFTDDDVATLKRLKLGVFNSLVNQATAANGYSSEIAGELEKN